MNNTKDLLVLQPADVMLFEGPFNNQIIKELKISNPNDFCVAFKLKTTSPRLFYVRPSFSVIKPNDAMLIEIFMQPNMQPNFIQTRHKFLVQAAVIVDPDNANLPDFWKTIKSEEIWNAKLRCELKPVDKADGNDSLRQAGGKSDSVVDGFGKMAKKIKKLEEERNYLKKELKNQESSTSKLMIKLQQAHSKYFYAAAIMLIFAAASIGLFLGKHYI